MNIHSIIPESEINGPGSRLVVFVQGCTRGCPGCFNPDTHQNSTRTLLTPEEIFEQNLRYLGPTGAISVEGITVSGGEPFLQPRPLLGLLDLARSEYGLTTIVYTGFTMEELTAEVELKSALELIDVLIDGPFISALKEDSTLARGSTNQRLHLLTRRYSTDDFVMEGTTEVIITPKGVLIETGFRGKASPGNPERVAG